MVAYVGITVVILAAFDWQPMAVYELASSKISENTGKPHTQLFSYEFKLSVEATVWAILFQRLFAAIKFGEQQEMVQRMHAAGSGRAIFKAMIGGASFSMLFCLIVMPVSWSFVGFYQKFPDLARAYSAHRPGAAHVRRATTAHDCPWADHGRCAGGAHVQLRFGNQFHEQRDGQ